MTTKKRKSFWIKKHTSDPYVKLAQKEGFRSRAAYKLLAIHEKDSLFVPGQIVLDLGSAPGAWSQVARQKTGTQGQVFAIDRLRMEPIERVVFIQGDLEETPTLNMLYDKLSRRKIDLVLSDMAPNFSGVSSIDQPRSRYLMELALEITECVLRQGGCFLVKCFHGKGFDEFLKKLRTGFHQVVIRKPEASRAHSSEVYILAKGYHL